MDNASRGPEYLSESWASISDADYSHDEDLQSENTDVGSLIDLYSVGDIQSVRDDTESEAEPGNEDEPSTPEQPLHESLLRSSGHTQHVTTSLVETEVPDSRQITLEEPEALAHLDQVLVKHTLKVFSPVEYAKFGHRSPSSAEKESKFVGTIHMTLNRAPLKETSLQSLR